MSERFVFVAGTGTGVGKTHVTVALLTAFARSGRRARAVKPVETGVSGPGDSSSDMARLATASGTDPKLGNAYAFCKPASPHLAAREVGVTIDVQRVRARIQEAAVPGQLLLIEGAGGLRVPLRPGYEMIDLARDLGAAVLLVGRAGLGTLNEVLLSLEALVRRGLPLAGTILNENRPGEDRAIVQDNLAYLRAHAPGGVWGLLPYGAARLEEHIDLGGLCGRLDVLQGGS